MRAFGYIEPSLPSNTTVARTPTAYALCVTPSIVGIVVQQRRFVSRSIRTIT